MANNKGDLVPQMGIWRILAQNIITTIALMGFRRQSAENDRLLLNHFCGTKAKESRDYSDMLIMMTDN